MADLTPHRPSTVRRVRYAFFDVVSFSTRSIEAQSDIVYVLTHIMRNCAGQRDTPPEGGKLLDPLYLPTGDGLCVVLRSEPKEPDVHIQIGLQVLRRLSDYNEAQSDPNRRFELRVGINENDDNIVEDINRRENVAGAGVNFAQRVMSLADGGQILVSAAVYDRIRYREKYLNAF